MVGFEAAPGKEGSSSTDGGDVAEGQVALVAAGTWRVALAREANVTGYVSRRVPFDPREGKEMVRGQSGTAKSVNHCRTVNLTFFFFC